MGDIIAIADVSNFQSGELALDLQDSEIVGHGLARMTEIREPVDDRNTGIFGHLLHDLVRESADHDALHHALEILGHVIDGLTFAKVDFGGRKIKGEPTKLVDADIEGNAGA